MTCGHKWEDSPKNFTYDAAIGENYWLITPTSNQTLFTATYHPISDSFCFGPKKRKTHTDLSHCIVVCGGAADCGITTSHRYLIFGDAILTDFPHNVSRDWEIPYVSFVTDGNLITESEF